MRALLKERQNEAAIIAKMNRILAPYQPASDAHAVTVRFLWQVQRFRWFCAGPGCRARTFFVALDKAEGGDLDGVRQNMTHELYHVLQKAAARRVPRAGRSQSQHDGVVPCACWLPRSGRARPTTPPMPARSRGRGLHLQMRRGRYLRNAVPARIAENLAPLRPGVGRETARQCPARRTAPTQRGFMGSSDRPFYFARLRNGQSTLETLPRPWPLFGESVLPASAGVLPGVRGFIPAAPRGKSAFFTGYRRCLAFAARHPLIGNADVTLNVCAPRRDGLL
ncbi:MAG: hypothetical protein WKG07_30705 [Hymenobacter sp.]